MKTINQQSLSSLECSWGCCGLPMSAVFTYISQGHSKDGERRKEKKDTKREEEDEKWKKGG